jgi:hypothetical protein
MQPSAVNNAMQTPTTLRWGRHVMKASFCVYVTVVTVIGLALLGCGKPASDSGASSQREINSARAEYELAQKNGDMNAAFLALRRLVDLNKGDSQAQADLKKIESAIVALNEIKSLALKKDGEAVMLKAEAFLRDYPNNLEVQSLVASARKDLDDKRKAIQDLERKLATAERNFDFPTGIQTLMEMKSVGGLSAVQAEKLKMFEETSDLLTKMRALRGDRNHEEVVKVADKLLVNFPEFPEARQALRESGLIYLYLEQALVRVAGSLSADMKSLRTVKSGDQEQVDLAGIAVNLKQADEFVEKATKLDPYFVQSLELQKRIKNAKTTLSYIIASDVSTRINNVLGAADDFFVKGWNALKGVLDANQKAQYSWQMRDQWEFWNANYEKQAVELNGLVQFILDSDATKVSLLADLKTEDTERLIAAVQKLAAQAPVLAGKYLQAGGHSVKSYGEAGGQARNEKGELINAVKATMPSSTRFADEFVTFIGLFSRYELYKNPDVVKPILKARKDLISA